MLTMLDAFGVRGGSDDLIEDNATIKEYMERIRARKSYQEAVLDWEKQLSPEFLEKMAAFRNAMETDAKFRSLVRC